MNDHARRPGPRDVVGIVPMAGTASRLGELPCSKEIFPVRPTVDTYDGNKPPRVVCEHLLGKMRAADIRRVYIVLRSGKWDIPAYLGDGSDTGLHLAYLMMGLPYGTPYSIDQAYPFLQQSVVALGFPDMILGQGELFARLLTQRETLDADVVLGIFPADQPEKVDVVDIDDEGKVKQIITKPQHTNLRITWGVAVWAPAFTHFMHEFLAVHKHTVAAAPELFVGNVIQAAIEQGLSVYGVRVSDQPFLDIGTIDNLRKL